jgi:hypothetical protein
MSPFKAGVIAVVLIAVFSFFGFSRYNPFKHEYTLYATFQSANNLQPKAPVRIAGINVGLVDEVTPLSNGSGMARVKMSIENKGLPIHTDATLKVRPRIFLEGNFFVISSRARRRRRSRSRAIRSRSSRPRTRSSSASC